MVASRPLNTHQHRQVFVTAECNCCAAPIVPNLIFRSFRHGHEMSPKPDNSATNSPTRNSLYRQRL